MGATAEARAVTQFVILENMLGSLPTFEAAQVRTLKAQAVSYVWGWQDAGGSERDSGVAWEFGMAYGIHAAEFAAQQRCYRLPIQVAFKAFRDGKAID